MMHFRKSVITPFESCDIHSHGVKGVYDTALGRTHLNVNHFNDNHFNDTLTTITLTTKNHLMRQHKASCRLCLNTMVVAS